MAILKEEFQLSKSFNLAEYDTYMKKKPLEQRLMLDVIIDFVHSNKDLKLIEFGAGTGRFTKLVLELFPNINLTLVEPDKMCCLELEKLKKTHNQIKIIQSSTEKFNSSKSYDLVVMATAFHHVPFKTKLIALKNIKKILNTKGLFLCGDNFIAEYTNMNEREIVLRKSINKWVKESKQNKKELKMALEMKKLVFRKDFGGEYFICPSIFESYVAKANLCIKGKINVTNTDPLDMEKYFYLIKKF